MLFIPPLLTPTISDPEDIILVLLYLFVAIIMGVMTSRTREQDQFLQKREENTERLHEIERDMATSTNLQYLRLNVCSRLENMFPGKFDVLTKGPDNKLIIESQLPHLKEEKEKAAAEWVFQNGKVGGWSTDTLPSVEGIYFPIKFSGSTVGVIVYFSKKSRPLSMEDMNFIQTVAQQLGIYLERFLFEEKVNRQDYTRQIERMHQSIFHSLNRSFYTPLEEISKINHQIQQAELSPHILSLVGKMDQFISNIKFTVDNIIAISELESGFVHFDRKKQSMIELIELSLNAIQPFVNEHPIAFRRNPLNLFFFPLTLNF